MLLTANCYICIYDGAILLLCLCTGELVTISLIENVTDENGPFELTLVEFSFSLVYVQRQNFQTKVEL